MVPPVVARAYDWAHARSIAMEIVVDTQHDASLLVYVAQPGQPYAVRWRQQQQAAATDPHVRHDVLHEPLVCDLAASLVVVPIIVGDHVALVPKTKLRLGPGDLRVVIITPRRCERDVLLPCIESLRVERLERARAPASPDPLDEKGHGYVLDARRARLVGVIRLEDLFQCGNDPQSQQGGSPSTRMSIPRAHLVEGNALRMGWILILRVHRARVPTDVHPIDDHDNLASGCWRRHQRGALVRG